LWYGLISSPDFWYPRRYFWHFDVWSWRDVDGRIICHRLFLGVFFAAVTVIVVTLVAAIILVNLDGFEVFG